MAGKPGEWPATAAAAASKSRIAKINAVGENNQPQRGKRLQQRLRIDSTEANRQDVGKGRQTPPPAAKVSALKQLLALSRRVGKKQAALVQSSQERMGGFQGEPVRREAPLETGFDLCQAGLAVKHFQDGVLFVAEVEIL